MKVIFNQESVYNQLQEGMKRGRSATRVLKSLPKSISVTKSGDGLVIVTYYGTDIVTVFPEGRVLIKNGGWATPSTRRYINNALRTLLPNQDGQPLGLFQKNYDEFFIYGGAVTPFGNRLTFSIADGGQLDTRIWY